MFQQSNIQEIFNIVFNNVIIFVNHTLKWEGLLYLERERERGLVSPLCKLTSQLWVQLIIFIIHIWKQRFVPSQFLCLILIRYINLCFAQKIFQQIISRTKKIKIIFLMKKSSKLSLIKLISPDFFSFKRCIMFYQQLTFFTKISMRFTLDQ